MTIVSGSLHNVDDLFMTYEQKTLFMNWVKDETTTFSDFWQHFNQDGVRLGFKDFSEEELMKAWLFPNSIVELRSPF